MRWAGILLAAVFLTACAVQAPLPPPPSSQVAPAPDLAGTWRGTWGGGPVALLLTPEPIEVGTSGVYLGNYELLGGRRPGVTGVLTSWISGAAVSSRAQGWLGSDARGRLVLVVQSETPDGTQRLTLARVAENQLQGSGDSSFRWGPRGPAELTRQPR
jgi:hypothetical protein